MKKRGREELAGLFRNLPGQDITLEQIYRVVARQPQDGMTPTQMHSRCSRAIGEVRAALKRDGLVLVLGQLKNSYKAVPLERRAK